jgi:Tol biopolymer transport system component
MVYRQFTQYPQDIWRVPGRKAPTPDREPERLITSSAADRNPAYSPDGRRIAFNSNRSGVLNVWVCDSDGSNPLQLTTHQKHSDTPRWSPDGRRILFNSNEAGVWDLYVVDARGGIPRRLTQAPSEDGNGTWSHDGRWIYFHSDRSGEFQIWKMPAEGGAAVQVTRGGGYYAQESWDGRHLYYVLSDPDRSGIWRVPVGGGEETEVVRGPVRDFDWAPSQSGIYYATTREVIPFRKSVYTISFLDLESGCVTELLRREGPFLHPTTLAVSPDEEWILYAENPSPTSELMLAENFR